MKPLFRVFSLIHALIAVLFVGISLLIIVIAAQTVWHALAAGLNEGAAKGIIEAIGLILETAVDRLQTSGKPHG